MHKILHTNDRFTMDVDRRVGLLGVQQAQPLMDLMTRMNWNYEISENEQLATSDNPLFWVQGGGPADPPRYGFGLGNPFAVIPFPLSSNVILRLDWQGDGAWKKFKLERQRARLVNQYQAKHKERLLFFRDRDEGLVSLAMKYKEPVNFIDIGVPSPTIDVVRNSRADRRDEEERWPAIILVPSLAGIMLAGRMVLVVSRRPNRECSRVDGTQAHSLPTAQFLSCRGTQLH